MKYTVIFFASLLISTQSLASDVELPTSKLLLEVERAQVILRDRPSYPRRSEKKG
jgi:hypothetical protein